MYHKRFELLSPMCDEVGVEPTRSLEHYVLNIARLPVSPLSRQRSRIPTCTKRSSFTQIVKTTRARLDKFRHSLVDRMGIEPIRSCEHKGLSLARLPVPPPICPEDGSRTRDISSFNRALYQLRYNPDVYDSSYISLRLLVHTIYLCVLC